MVVYLEAIQLVILVLDINHGPAWSGSFGRIIGNLEDGFISGRCGVSGLGGLIRDFYDVTGNFRAVAGNLYDITRYFYAVLGLNGLFMYSIALLNPFSFAISS